MGAADKDRVEEVAGWLRLFVAPGQVTELRAIKVQSGSGGYAHTEAGFYDHDHLADMAKAALEINSRATGVYFVINPIHPDLLHRCANRLRVVGKDESVSDNHILARNWFVIDADPSRMADISSTDAEKAHSRDMIVKAREVVQRAGFADRLVFADSGNGYHLACRVNLPHDDGSLVKLFLDELGDALDSGEVKIDRKMFNPARVVKLYGTYARKGDSTEKRPHRRSSVIEVIDL